MSKQKEPTTTEVFKQLTEILQKALSRINDVEKHITKDLESIRRQLDAVGVLKDNIENLNNRLDSMSKKLSELSKQEPQELSRLMIRAISELDKRMQMFTITEVLARLEAGTGIIAPGIEVTATTAKPATTKASKPAVTPAKSKTPATATAKASKPDAVADESGTDTPWREQMRQKYGLKRKPGTL